MRDRLTDDGVFVATYATDRPWIFARIAAAARAAFGVEPLLGGRGHALCAIGRRPLDPGRLPPTVRAWILGNRVAPPPADQSFPTDDRPFLTIARRSLPGTYWIAMLVVVLMTGTALRCASLPTRAVDVKFFALGAALLLAETQLITVIGLLFGVTWQAYGVAIAVVLATLVAGTLAATRRGGRACLVVAYALLVGVVLASRLAPQRAMLALPTAQRLAASALVFGPTFLLGAYVFGREIAEVDPAGVNVAMASNLLGAVAGGFLEYQAIAFGVSSLSLTAAGFYLLAGALALARRPR